MPDHRSYRRSPSPGRRRRSRSRDRSRRTRERDRDFSESPPRSYDKRDSKSYSSRERDYDRDRGRDRGYEGHRDRERPQHLRKEDDRLNRGLNNFSSAGVIFPDQGQELHPAVAQQDYYTPAATAQQDYYAAAATAQQQDYYQTAGANGSQLPRYSSYSDHLEAGLDGDVTAPPSTSSDYNPFQASAAASYGSMPSRRGNRHPPSATIYIKHIPEDKDESDLQALLGGYQNIVAIRLMRDRVTGASRGFAFVDFVSAEDAMVLMETDDRLNMYLGDNRLHLDYSTGPPAAASSSGAGGAATAAVTAANLGAAASSTAPGQPLDWICERCAAVNFARRLECYQCSTDRPKNPQRVSLDPEGPSHILKVSNLEPHVSDEHLHSLFGSIATLKDVRLVRDKFSGAPRGFAFIHFNSIAEAGMVMQNTQGQIPPFQSTPLRLCYAKDRVVPTQGTSALANDALQAAQAMQQYSGWEPKEFKEGDDEEDDTQQKGATAAAAGDGEVQATGQATAATANAAGPSGQSAESNFVYDPNSGYWYDAASGYYYDANTGLYYHHSTQQWYAYDQSTGQYTAASSDATHPTQQQQQQQPEQQQTYQQPEQQQPYQQQQQQQQYQQQQQQPPFVQQVPLQQQPTAAAAATYQAPIAVAAAPATVAAAPAATYSAAPQVVAAPKPAAKRGAVIGAPAQLNPEGLLEAAQQAQERIEQQKALAAAQAAAQKKQQNKNKKKQQPQQQNAAARPGIGAAGAPAPAVTSAAAAAAVPVQGNGGVAGVIHRGKWSQRTKAQ